MSCPHNNSRICDKCRQIEVEASQPLGKEEGLETNEKPSEEITNNFDYQLDIEESMDNILDDIASELAKRQKKEVKVTAWKEKLEADQLFDVMTLRGFMKKKELWAVYSLPAGVKSLLEDKLLTEGMPVEAKESDLKRGRVETKADENLKRAKGNPPELHEIDWSKHCLPSEVIPPPLMPTDPVTFLTQEWLTDTVSSVDQWCAMQDDNVLRVPPMAFVRCSRGGKTRALQEVGRALKAKFADTSIIYISFNDWSSLETWEQDNPTSALCRRIAFASFGKRDFEHSREQYQSFANADVSSEEIVKWLGDKPCVLLIDELNQLTALEKREARYQPAVDFGNFLKDNFLKKKDRYLVFSAHVITTSGLLDHYMESVSPRGVEVRELPFVENLDLVRASFGYPLLNARTALYYGLVPSLLFECKMNFLSQLDDARKLVVFDCITSKLFTDETVLDLLSSFVTGNSSQVISPLLRYMTAGKSETNKPVVLWIPFHMHQILVEFAAHASSPLSRSMKNWLLEICDHLQFNKSKTDSGDSWEDLFLVALMIRVATGVFDACLLPLHWRRGQFSFSFNQHGLKGDSRGKDLDKYLLSLAVPQSFPHVAVYYPIHAEFPTYDVIVAVFEANKQRLLYGYQLKQGENRPKGPPSPQFEENYLVRGLPKKKKTTVKQWTPVTDQQMSSFFGESGRHWTPNNWAKLS